MLNEAGDQIDSDDVATGTQPTTSIYSDPDADPPTLWTGIDEVYGNTDPANVTDGHQYRSTSPGVHVVDTATSANTGAHVVTHLMVKDGKFLAVAGDAGANPTRVFSYDDDDTFIDSTAGSGGEGRAVSLERFQTLLDQDDNHNTIGNGDSPTDAAVDIEVVIYNADGTSVFRVTDDGSGG